ncbi:hypothetical protein GGX14DRAFT_677109 [Mycena pura]|uniref:Uncharacterized protein n=1 Tax=Mycena pura TaxID=153505 RepID=A0AAD6UVG9_9AGAR|nr:hypothetical protein GGX14DRAFT_677109 [Mycena pura]
MHVASQQMGFNFPLAEKFWIRPTRCDDIVHMEALRGDSALRSVLRTHSTRTCGPASLRISTTLSAAAARTQDEIGTATDVSDGCQGGGGTADLACNLNREKVLHGRCDNRTLSGSFCAGVMRVEWCIERWRINADGLMLLLHGRDCVGNVNCQCGGHAPALIWQPITGTAATAGDAIRYSIPPPFSDHRVTDTEFDIIDGVLMPVHAGIGTVHVCYVRARAAVLVILNSSWPPGALAVIPLATQRQSKSRRELNLGRVDAQI